MLLRHQPPGFPLLLLCPTENVFSEIRYEYYFLHLQEKKLHSLLQERSFSPEVLLFREVISGSELNSLEIGKIGGFLESIFEYPNLMGFCCQKLYTKFSHFLDYETTNS